MSKISHITVIEKYEENRNAIQHLLGSILTSIANDGLFDSSQEELGDLVDSLYEYYPFVSLILLLDKHGKQICMNIPGGINSDRQIPGNGADRSKRPYFIQAKNQQDVVVTEPYLSNIRRELCLSATQNVYNDDGSIKGSIVLDFDLVTTISFLTGETGRFHFEPYFKVIYSLIVIGLFIVSFILMFLAGNECLQVIRALSGPAGPDSIPFGVVIYLTLALAIFDLGKTTLEEEVLLYKDILRHSSTRRTISRFIGAIIIALSIEALLMIFKGALRSGEVVNSGSIVEGVWVVFAAAFLLLSLGGYIFLSSHAETLLEKGQENPAVNANGSDNNPL